MLENLRQKKILLEDLWRQKSDEKITAAATQLTDYTEEARQVIRSEMRKRGIPAPPVAARTGSQSHQEKELVTARVFSHAHDAEIAKSQLEAEGVLTYLADENTVTANWLYSNAIGGVKLQVASDDIERATKLLEVNPIICPVCQLLNPIEAEVCVACGHNLQAKEKQSDMTADQERCEQCGAAMSETDAECERCGYIFDDGRRKSSEYEYEIEKLAQSAFTAGFVGASDELCKRVSIQSRHSPFKDD